MGRKSADFSAENKSADFRNVSGLFVRPFFSVFWQIFFIGKVGKKNRPILPIGRFSRQ
ncbi:unnamed protein product [Staurois parvus]|uniref:Uncharacterized protein n=1 Tax=Staurois parvus TaxID=386267 RepID=A0ABN9HMQ9_9NEOB|nr:unnamed protein product [Staurois parvus]